ncbi:hypothetical protein Bbelb_364900 [Branchiostoma belcheri]|nr:hypothetical protein Bbelb_364900 [Branchiostoma belcheri]
MYMYSTDRGISIIGIRDFAGYPAGVCGISRGRLRDIPREFAGYHAGDCGISRGILSGGLSCPAYRVAKKLGARPRSLPRLGTAMAACQMFIFTSCRAICAGPMESDAKYNTGYSVSPEVSARPRVGSPDGRRPEGDPTRGRAGTEGDAEYTVLDFIYIIPTQENAPFNAR